MFYKKGVLKILQYSQENTCAWASFLIKKIKKEEINLKISDRLAYEEMLPVTYIIIKVKWIPKISIKSDNPSRSDICIDPTLYRKYWILKTKQ